ncbi:nucleotidyltransferase domain-containing protein [Pseudophaeobacter sp.]|uniref:nucleotidyltransferase domain-containing protein n=1 Tax=Pseudophaeobacter sp. TaxID=1971739 RepID=UPI00329897D6
MTEAVSAGMRALIQAKLKEIETEEDLRILFAVESGSRAWGFHSPDSDYDVRFVYSRPLSWHLRLDAKRDVVEYPIDDELDLSGWELGKALKLACNSNAVIAEWLQSPIVYLADQSAVSALREFCDGVLDRRAVTWHYVQLMERQQSRLRGPGGEIRLKRYFYILRPALALRWMRLQQAPVPPMNMGELMQGCGLDAALTDQIAGLTRRKAELREKAEAMPDAPLIDALIAEENQAAKDWLQATSGERRRADWQAANQLHQRFSADG